MVDIGIIIASINTLVAFVVLYLIIQVVGELRDTKLFNMALFLALTSVMFVIHAGIEILGFGETLYAISALITSIFFFLAVWFARSSVANIGGT